MPSHVKQICYSERYSDDQYEYRHVILPPDIAKKVPQTHVMTETEWRNLGVQQSPGWIHYMLHKPENKEARVSTAPEPISSLVNICISFQNLTYCYSEESKQKTSTLQA